MKCVLSVAVKVSDVEFFGQAMILFISTNPGAYS